eukprot:TRINITY_DN1481_c0_g1_i2.p1 TRINITY_DN1481_c0_g1~~TRINITY_DN1481_c0_g1_i2.p1  ORF type:complete len:274 (-),score=34.23 TRINITY_DN1481_c0_g1_i2:203-1024(-)
MSIAGACPGMVVVQVGANVPWSWATLLGGVLGAFIYCVFEPGLKKIARIGQLDPATAYELLGCRYSTLAGVMAVLLVLVVVGIELLAPWDAASEIGPSRDTDAFFLLQPYWYPELCGVIIGALQVPLILCASQTLGSSSAYVSVLALSVNSKGCEPTRWEYLSKFDPRSMNNLWQVLYLAGAIVGAFVATVGSKPSKFGPDEALGVPPAFGVVGGVLMLLGSRMADGCTSGHGLSGMACLGLKSFVAVGAMFGGGIAAIWVMKALDLDTYKGY